MISKTAIKEDNYKQHIYFTNSAREGWELILKTLGASDKVLLPSYIGITEREGSGIYDPVMNTGVLHEFYTLNKDLSVSIDSLESLIKSGDCKMILLVHYFGFKISNLSSIVALCKSYNIIVVEDCAHLYNYNAYGFSDAGTLGDYAFYSLHKFFPIDSGGVLVQHFNSKLPKHDFKIELNSDYANCIIKYDLKGIIDRRIENFKFLDELIKEVDGVVPIKVLKADDVPHNYPIIVNDNLRERLYFWLIERNVTLIALYYRLIPTLSFEKYKDMHEVSNSILNLPIHQDITKKDLVNLVGLINEGITSLRNG